MFRYFVKSTKEQERLFAKDFVEAVWSDLLKDPFWRSYIEKAQKNGHATQSG